jgi:hypothetical protein
MIDRSSSDLTEWDDDDFGAYLADSVEVFCPYCGEGIDIGVDQAGGEVQEYIEDCQVCCQPLSVRVTVGWDGTASVTVGTLDEG